VTREPDPEPTHRRAVGAVLVAAVAGILGATVWHLPREGAALPAVARQALDTAMPVWHTLEPVNEVVYGSRGFDTFGETFLLLAAVIGIGLVTRAREPRSGFVGEELAGAREEAETPHKDAQGMAERRARAAESEEAGRSAGPATPDREPLGTRGERSEGMTVVVRGAVRALAPVLAISGIYLAAWGFSPGGGFPAGAVLLGVLLLAWAAFGHRRVERAVRPSLVEAFELAGAALVVLTELGGLLWRGSFSANFLPLGQLGTIPSGGILQVFSGSELIEVGTGLTLAVFGVLGMAHDWADDGEGDGAAATGKREQKASR
jgi:multicomponent Na+:H+ antiporter subunit B